ncbi:TMhelix containing protein [Vibrio phage 1.152.O._10N.222.46.E1]|uniref:TMhelix containing protein n=4 Tax=Nahantvirus 49C7 TaxID=2846601 RepID=A0A2I7RBG1_9CAUD|nr:TMhelix containing protein [Vibrio phage 1.025.O._10N.222.46.B6]AUR90812.1 TMhelix containing protein [Vibrio phage 1.150.O._10N.222.46.A6]AUR90985.1 TMhelix containing protein [Vibrio phage 1.152.O._10N.222.46.E1]AUS02453.1 TMhelix containing protein [Vibrio phage 2.130.O._10N.222.46.C2]
MSKPYGHTFVIGKFMNFHQGHEALIKRAIELGTKTTVLMSREQTDPVHVGIRQKWLSDTFGNWITLCIVDIDATGLSNKSESGKEVSAQWAEYIKDRFHGVDCITNYLDQGVILMVVEYSVFLLNSIWALWAWDRQAHD